MLLWFSGTSPAVRKQLVYMRLDWRTTERIPVRGRKAVLIIFHICYSNTRKKGEKISLEIWSAKVRKWFSFVPEVFLFIIWPVNLSTSHLLHALRIFTINVCPEETFKVAIIAPFPFLVTTKLPHFPEQSSLKKNKTKQNKIDSSNKAVWLVLSVI